MTEQQQHLEQLIKQARELQNELETLQNTSIARRELFWKVQGAIEYLSQIGVKLPEPEETAEVSETEVVE